MIFKNKHGKAASKKTTPPDLKQCQAFPNVVGHSFMSLGPPPKPVRCTTKPKCVAVENKPSDGDRLIGSMSLCADCLRLFTKMCDPDRATIVYL